MVSNTFSLIFAIVSLSMLVGMFIVLIVFLRKSFLSRTIRVMVIEKDRKITPHRVKNIQETFSLYGNEEYFYNPSFEVKRKFWKEIYYLRGIPNPVNWWEVDEAEFEKAKVGKITLSTVNFKNIIQKKLMDNILQRKDDLPIILFLIVLGILMLINAYFGFQTMQGVSIADTPENVEFIRRVIIGG